MADFDKDIAWKHYELISKTQVDYIKTVINLNVFYYGISGAIFSYSFNNHFPIIVYLFPAIMGFFSE
jgi:hypothetical protein